MPGRTRQDTGRADRILDAAAGLLVRVGYRKVTIDDIAESARIGKGTVYLHWRTKQQLLEAVLLREAINYVDGLAAEVRGDSSTALPHRLTAASFLLVRGNPVLRGMFAANADQARITMADPAMRSHELLADTRFFELLTRHGLLRDDVPNAAYAWSAIQAGFHLLADLDAPTGEMDVDAQAQSLAYVVRSTLEPAGEPDQQAVTAAASELVGVFEDILPPYRAWIYQNPTQPEATTRPQNAAEVSERGSIR